jgi:hypothetical protein
MLYHIFGLIFSRLVDLIFQFPTWSRISPGQPWCNEINNIFEHITRESRGIGGDLQSYKRPFTTGGSTTPMLGMHVATRTVFYSPMRFPRSLLVYMQRSWRYIHILLSVSDARPVVEAARSLRPGAAGLARPPARRHAPRAWSPSSSSPSRSTGRRREIRPTGGASAP